MLFEPTFRSLLLSTTALFVWALRVAGGCRRGVRGRPGAASAVWYLSVRFDRPIALLSYLAPFVLFPRAGHPLSLLLTPILIAVCVGVIYLAGFSGCLLRFDLCLGIIAKSFNGV